MLSKKLQTIVAITGAIDLVTDGSSCYVIRMVIRRWGM